MLLFYLSYLQEKVILQRYVEVFVPYAREIVRCYGAIFYSNRRI